MAIARGLAIVLFLAAIGFAVDAAREQASGIAVASAPRMFRASSAVSLARADASATGESDDPEGFRGLMAYQWIRVALCVGAALALWSLAARADSLDPFAPKRP